MLCLAFIKGGNSFLLIFSCLLFALFNHWQAKYSTNFYYNKLNTASTTFFVDHKIKPRPTGRFRLVIAEWLGAGQGGRRPHKTGGRFRQIIFVLIVLAACKDRRLWLYKTGGRCKQVIVKAGFTVYWIHCSVISFTFNFFFCLVCSQTWKFTY